MKAISTSFLVIAFFLSLHVSGQPEQSMEISFPTTGNCYLCKVRIETAVNKLDGIEAVNWDAVTDVTTVTYDDNQIDAYEIMQIIAFVGHETEWYPANDSAYAALQGTCCLYTKVIDYTNVQIGYLGMMGIWVWQLTGIEAQSAPDISLIPGQGNGSFSIQGKGLASYDRITLEVYTVTGQKAHTETFAPLENHQVNLQHLNSGYYIVLLSSNNETLYNSKIYKH